jgi:hypothetical protein
MTTRTSARAAAQCLAGVATLAAASYGAYVGFSWASYGHARRARNLDEQDTLLDRFMPLYDVVERHHIAVDAPPGVTSAAAREVDLMQSRLARAIFKGRELAMGAPRIAPPPAGLVPAVLSLGWGVLADVPDREIVIGGYTRPWEAKVVFRSLPPDAFASFADPGYVKIAWTLRADPVAGGGSVFRTETRAMATDVDARARFRIYWALVSPGIEVIRRSSLAPIKREAERRARSAAISVAV